MQLNSSCRIRKALCETQDNAFMNSTLSTRVLQERHIRQIVTVVHCSGCLSVYRASKCKLEEAL